MSAFSFLLINDLQANKKFVLKLYRLIESSSSNAKQNPANPCPHFILFVNYFILLNKIPIILPCPLILLFYLFNSYFLLFNFLI